MGKCKQKPRIQDWRRCGLSVAVFTACFGMMNGSATAQAVHATANFSIKLESGWTWTERRSSVGPYYRAELPSPINPTCSVTEEARNLSKFTQEEINQSFKQKKPLGDWPTLYPAASLGMASAPPPADVYWDSVAGAARSRIASYYPGKDGKSEYRIVGAVMYTPRGIGSVICTYPTRPPVMEQGERPYVEAIDAVVQRIVSSFRPAS